MEPQPRFVRRRPLARSWRKIWRFAKTLTVALLIGLGGGIGRDRFKVDDPEPTGRVVHVAEPERSARPER